MLLIHPAPSSATCACKRGVRARIIAQHERESPDLSSAAFKVAQWIAGCFEAGLSRLLKAAGGVLACSFLEAPGVRSARVPALP